MSAAADSTATTAGPTPAADRTASEQAQPRPVLVGTHVALRLARARA